MTDKRKQDERVYYKIGEGKPEGWATVAGDYDLIVILKPEVPINSYSHIYVSQTQIVEPPSETEKTPKVVEAED